MLRKYDRGWYVNFDIWFVDNLILYYIRIIRMLWGFVYVCKIIVIVVEMWEMFLFNVKYKVVVKNNYF